MRATPRLIIDGPVVNAHVVMVMVLVESVDMEEPVLRYQVWVKVGLERLESLRLALGEAAEAYFQEVYILKV